MWLTGGGILAVLGWLLYRAEKRVDDIQERLTAAEQRHAEALDEADKRHTERLDAAEQRYRDMAEKYAGRTYEAITTLGEATSAVRAMAEERDHDRRR